VGVASCSLNLFCLQTDTKRKPLGRKQDIQPVKKEELKRHALSVISLGSLHVGHGPCNQQLPTSARSSFSLPYSSIV